MKRYTLILYFLTIYMSVAAQPGAALLKSADSLRNLEKYDAAIQLYSKIIKQTPGNEKALTGRGWSYSRINKLALAEKDYTDAIKANSKCVECRVSFGGLKLFQNDKAGATALATEAITFDEKYSRAWTLKGRIALADKKYKDAAASLNKAISLDSSSGDAFFFRATLFIEMQLFESALNDLSTVNKIEPAYSSAYYEAGVIYANQQKWAEAMDRFLLAIQKDSTNPLYYKSVGNVYVYKKDPLTAIKFYNKAIKLDDKDVEAYLYRGDAYRTLEDMDAYCGDIKLAIAKLTPKSDSRFDKEGMIKGLSEFCDSTLPGFYYQRGIANYNLHQFNKSVEWYNRGLAKFPQHFMLTFFKGNTEISLQQFDKAESDYTRAITLKDNLTEETNKSFNFRQASDYEKKRYVDASIAEVYRHRSEARLSMNNYTGAIADVDEAVKMIFSQMEGKEAIYNTKAAIYMAQNDNTNALSWLNKALDASPDYAIARVNRAIVKFNLAYKTSVISSEISIKSNPGSNFRLNLPDKTKTVVIKDNIESALVDCNKAIEADPSYAYAYYIRGVIKMGLDQPDYCYDILKSEQLGFTAAKAVIEELKCR